MSFPPLRADLGDLEAYSSPQVGVPVRLNTNESPYPPPEAFVRQLAAELAEIPLHRYPDRSARALRESLAGFLGQPAERIVAANGSNEVLQALLLAYGGPGRKAAVFEPGYVMHAHIARITGTELVVGERGPDFTLEPDAALALVAEHRPHLVVLCNPNNPTGTVDPPEVARALLGAGTTLVVVDEAYGEFAPRSALEFVGDEVPLVVVRSFSKVWSLAAIRLGYAVAAPRVAADLEKVLLPYHLSAPAQAAGRLALRWRAEMEARVQAIVAERDRVAAALAALDGVEVFPSGANFLLFRPPGDGHAVWEALFERGVLVRDFSRRPRVEGCLRVTVGTPEENDAFLSALKEVLG